MRSSILQQASRYHNLANVKVLDAGSCYASAYTCFARGNAVQRDFDAVAWELKVIFSLDDDQPLLEWQLGEISTTKPEKRSKQWCLGCAELMRDLRKALQDNSKSLVKSFVRWSDSTLSDKAIAGIAFADCTDLNNLDLVFENVHVSCMGQNLSLSLSLFTTCRYMGTRIYAFKLRCRNKMKIIV